GRLKASLRRGRPYNRQRVSEAAIQAAGTRARRHRLNDTEARALAALAPLSLRELLDRLSSSDPVPGGGSAAALAGAMGASLVSLVAALTAGRAEHAESDAAPR